MEDGCCVKDTAADDGVTRDVPSRVMVEPGGTSSNIMQPPLAFTISMVPRWLISMVRGRRVYLIYLLTLSNASVYQKNEIEVPKKNIFIRCDMEW